MVAQAGLAHHAMTVEKPEQVKVKPFLIAALQAILDEMFQELKITDDVTKQLFLHPAFPHQAGRRVLVVVLAPQTVGRDLVSGDYKQEKWQIRVMQVPSPSAASHMAVVTTTQPTAAQPVTGPHFLYQKLWEYG